jgi:Na+/H+-dicarboxylate symporter/ABC-type amino acid transport substrate-binding protein
MQVVGRAYVGLLQMTVLPYLLLSLTSKTARLDVKRARGLGLAAVVVLLAFWLIGILLVVAVSTILPPAEGASFFSPNPEVTDAGGQDYLVRFIPINVFHSLSAEYVPAVVVFSLFFGGALMLVPGKEPLLDFLDLCSASIGRINVFLVRLAPIGLFALSAAAAGTMRIEEFSRLQAYLAMFTLACCAAALGFLPLLVSSLTPIGYRDLFRAAQEPLLTAIATGKLFVVLPQITDKCEQLIAAHDESAVNDGDSTASVIVPLAYPFPHIGKILAFVFIPFAAWYVGRALTPGQTAAMAATGAVSSFASPLITVPYLLDRYQLPQDLMALFILPGFITTRLADVVGVMHLMALTLIVTVAQQGRIQIRWRLLLTSSIAVLSCLALAGGASSFLLRETAPTYDLDQRLLALEIPSPCKDVVVYSSRDEVPLPPQQEGSTLQRIKTDRVLRVGYHADHLPFSFFNQQQHLVGMDVELLHGLATRLQVRLEFIPYSYESVVEQLENGEFDVAVGGLVLTPELLLQAGFTQPYQTATIAIVLPDHRRNEFDTWDDPRMAKELRLAVVHEDVAIAARRQLPDIEIVAIDSIRSFFTGQDSDLNGLLMSAEEGAAWNVLFPEHTVVVPHPVVQRPVGMAVRSSDTEWLRFLDRWLDFERMDGSLERLRVYWVEGGGTQKRAPRWCVVRDVLHWVP